MWWENFIKWCFIGVGAIFFTYLAALVIEKGLFADPAAAQDAANVKLGTLGFLVPIIFLLVGLKITRGSSAMGASAVLGLAGGVAGYVGGKVLGAGKAITGKTVGGAAKAAGGRIRDSKIGQGIGGAIGGLKEGLGLTPKGTTAQLLAKRRGESKKRLQNLNSEKLARVAESRTHSRREKAAAAEVLAERGDLNKIKPEKLEDVVSNATTYGVPRSTFEKADPTLSRPKIPTKMEREIEAQKLTKQKTEELKGLAVSGGATPKKAKKIAKRGIKLYKDEIKAKAGGRVSELMYKEKQTLISNGVNPKNTARMVKIYKPTAVQQATTEAVQKRVRKMTPKEYLNMSPEAIKNETVMDASSPHLIKTLQRGTSEQIAAAKTHMARLNTRAKAAYDAGIAARASGNIAQATKKEAESSKYTNLYKAINKLPS